MSQTKCPLRSGTGLILLYHIWEQSMLVMENWGQVQHRVPLRMKIVLVVLLFKTQCLAPYDHKEMARPNLSKWKTHVHLLTLEVSRFLSSHHGGVVLF